MTSRFVDAAIKVLEREKAAMKPGDICRVAIQEHYLLDFGNTPDATMRAQLMVESRKENPRIVKDGKRYRLAASALS